MKEALLRQGFVNVPQMTSCLETERQSIVRALLPPAPDKQDSGKVVSASAQRVGRKAPAALQGACVSQAPDAQAGGAQADWHPP